MLARLEGIGIDFLHLAQATENPDADPLDLLCHLAFQRPLRTRKERAEHLRKGNPDFFDRYNHKAQKIFAALLDKYTDHGPEEFKIPRALQNSPIVEHGNPMEIADLFGGPLEMRQAVDRLQTLLYIGGFYLLVRGYAARPRGRAAARYWLDLLSDLGFHDFEAIFRQVPASLISEPAIEFALEMLEANKARLLTTSFGE